MACTAIKRFKDCQTLLDWKECMECASPTLNSLRGAFTAILRVAFSDASRLPEELGCLLYNSDDSKSELYISAGSEMDPGDTEQVPGLIISMGEEGVALEKIGVDTVGRHSSDMSSRTATYMANVTVKILCRHTDADVACMLSDYVMLYLTAMEDKFRNSVGWLKDYSMLAQTEPKLASSGQEGSSAKWHESTVALRLKYEYSIFIAEESKRLKDFSMDLTPEPLIIH